LFSGRIDEAEERFTRALELLRRLPDDERDRITATTLVGYLGLVAEARDEWSLAADRHADALRLRREVADARGVLHSTHRLGRARLRLGDEVTGLALLAEAEQMADDLDEPLERAKLTHQRATLAVEAGDCTTAGQLAGQALAVFERCATRYDVAHARLTLSQAAQACGDERAAVEHGATARTLVERWGYGLLRRQ
jgi:tetratricopeptide (TPR) repeat protein